MAECRIPTHIFRIDFEVRAFGHGDRIRAGVVNGDERRAGGGRVHAGHVRGIHAVGGQASKQVVAVGVRTDGS